MVKFVFSCGLPNETPRIINVNTIIEFYILESTKEEDDDKESLVFEVWGRRLPSMTPRNERIKRLKDYGQPCDTDVLIATFYNPIDAAKYILNLADGQVAGGQGVESPLLNLVNGYFNGFGETEKLTPEIFEDYQRWRLADEFEIPFDKILIHGFEDKIKTPANERAKK